MRIKSIFIIVLVLVLIGCKSKDIGESQIDRGVEDLPVVEDIPEPDVPIVSPIEDVPLPVEEPNVQELLIMNKGVIEPNSVSIDLGTTLRFVNKDSKNHKIACNYEIGGRAYLGDNLLEGMSSEFKPESKGGYTCLEIIYGFRVDVLVK